MPCARCGGLLVTDYTTCGTLRIARCISCGDILDHLILTRRYWAWEYPFTFDGGFAPVERAKHHKDTFSRHRDRPQRRLRMGPVRPKYCT